MSVCAQTRYIYGTRCESLPPAPPTQADLEQQIADLERAMLQLRRRVSDLEHRTNDRQAAHNAAAVQLELWLCG